MRHGGFIPWDDDIDIGMPKDDFDRFCEIAPALLPKGYSLHTSANTKGFAPLWTKVFKNDTKFIEDVCTEAGYEQGIFVDILPFCRLDANEAVAKKQCRKARAAQVQSYLKHFAHPKIPTDIPGVVACNVCLQSPAQHHCPNVEDGKSASPNGPRLRHG